jgi:hypothetical protein
MKRADILALKKHYATLLDAAGAVAQQAKDLEARWDAGRDRRTILNHARWICNHIDKCVDVVGGNEFCVRWLGALQAIVVVYGLQSLADIRRHMDKHAEGGFSDPTITDQWTWKPPKK